MTVFLKGFASRSGLLASALLVVTTTGALAWEEKPAAEKPAAVQNAVFNGFSCDHVRAKVAENGVTAAYAYARYMGLTSRDIARVRKACAV